MGCDIHSYKEKKVDGKWVAADNWVDYDYGEGDKGKEVKYADRFTGRNYELFGMLAKGVRTEHPFSFEPRGIPFNACTEVRDEHKSWDVDAHSASYLYLHELKDLREHLDSVVVSVSGMKSKGELHELSASIASGKPDWNLIFPYSKFTTRPNHEYFEIDVPVSFYVGEALDAIIESFDGIEGENHRLVFFFDN